MKARCLHRILNFKKKSIVCLENLLLLVFFFVFVDDGDGHKSFQSFRLSA